MNLVRLAPCMTAILGLAVCSGTALGADPLVVLSPVAVVSNSAGDINANFPITATINRSGLLDPFVSGQTQFVTYYQTTPLHSPGGGAMSEWANPAASSIIIYDLGQAFDVGGVMLWNGPFGIGSSIIDVSNSVTFDVFTPFTTYAPSANNGVEPYPPQFKTATPVNGRDVRLTINDPRWVWPKSHSSCRSHR